MKRNIPATLIFLLLTIGISVISCDKPDVTEPNDKQEQTENNGNENEGGNEDGTGNENDETPPEGEGEGETEIVKSMTITLEKVTATKAYFKASTKKTAPDIEIGIYYSTDAGDHIYDCERVWDYDLENGECELVIKGLDANTTYYYRPYLFIDGMRELGDELSFTTADYFISVDVTVDGTDATFSGYVDIDGRGGILYSTESQLSVDNCIGNITPLNDEYSYTLTNLSENTTYYYCSYYKSYENGSYVYGDVGSFTTEKDKYTETSKDLSLGPATDLSASGTANCYIVSKIGLYKIKAVKGNDANHTLANASTATILWETFGTDVKPNKLDLIKEFCYKDGYVVFRTSDTYREGNALIAVKDGNGNILWSWHIWMTDQPQEHVYPNDAGIMMDRNLGATSVTPGDIGTLGLYYQWGRKDPFLGPYSIDTSGGAETTVSCFTVELDSHTGTIEYSVTNPMAFIRDNRISNNYGHYHWLYNSNSTLWTSQKTLYDPCPVGWRVPDGGESGIWARSNFDEWSKDDTNRGYAFTLSTYLTTWYPLTGIYLWDNSVNVWTYKSYYWSCTFNNTGEKNNAFCLELDHSNAIINTTGSKKCGVGCPVRCLKE